MNRHYDNYLSRKYPILYQDRHASAHKTVMCWGFSCGDGWFNIINNLSKFLSAPYLYAVDNYEFAKAHNFSAERIEKAREEVEFLRKTHPVAIQVKEKFGGLRFYLKNSTPEIDKAVQLAETMSYNTCEVCGKRGTRRDTSWIRTLCNEHAKLHRDLQSR